MFAKMEMAQGGAMAKTGSAQPKAARSSARKSSARSETPQAAVTKERRDSYSRTLRTPFLTAHFELPKPAVLRTNAAVLDRPLHLGPVALPAPSKTLYYAGLGALAVAEVVEWPIVAAIAAGTYIAQHTRSDRPAVPHLEHHEVSGDGAVPDQRAAEPA